MPETTRHEPRDALDVLYVAGASYSGSTLLAMVLDCHPELAGIGEVGPAPGFEGTGLPCTCGATVATCPLIGAAEARAVELGHPVSIDRGELRLRHSRHSAVDRLLSRHLGSHLLDRLRDAAVRRSPAWSRALREQGGRTVAFARAVLELTGARVFVDTTKVYQRITFLAALPEVRLRVLHLVRDPRAFTRSAARNDGMSPERAARSWVRAHRAIASRLDALPGVPRARVRYEDLGRAPDETWQRLCDFAGVERVPLPDDFRAFEHHVIGNRMRLRPGDDGRIHLNERWREELDPAAVAATERIAGPLARRYGYA